MFIYDVAITGAESIDTKISSQKSALIEFYSAFNKGDMGLMSENWVQTEEVSMSNPLGGVKRGWESIREVYDRIFNGEARVYVEFYGYTIHSSDSMFVAVGRERGYLEQGENRIDLSIRTSRIYRMDCNKWHQIHHHGSIEDPSLLEKYQVSVLGKK
ncbi:Alternative dihydrofolate reductase 3 [hydrothermal vent metagenome]|uniref:Alternative dihydrofolate reductase 3 n=1 Tax=hydrothermal vent metagenome TaxID=652676 RepID=A0A3B0X319_9ZZZZ